MPHTGQHWTSCSKDVTTDLPAPKAASTSLHGIASNHIETSSLTSSTIHTPQRSDKDVRSRSRTKFKVGADDVALGVKADDEALPGVSGIALPLGRSAKSRLLGGLKDVIGRLMGSGNEVTYGDLEHHDQHSKKQPSLLAKHTATGLVDQHGQTTRHEWDSRSKCGRACLQGHWGDYSSRLPTAGVEGAGWSCFCPRLDVTVAP